MRFGVDDFRVGESTDDVVERLLAKNKNRIDQEILSLSVHSDFHFLILLLLFFFSKHSFSSLIKSKTIIEYSYEHSQIEN